MRSIKVSGDELRKRSLHVATPMYGGQCFGLYLHSMMRLQAAMANYGITFKFHSIANESLVTRARNYCVNEFLRGDCTHFMFIDSDIEFLVDDVLSLLWHDKDVICGLYPKKVIRWDRIENAVRNGVRGEDLAECGADLAFSPKGLEGSFDLYEPLEVPEAASGFMMIKRSVFEEFEKAYPDKFYHSDGRERKSNPSKILACFETYIDENGRYLSEDFNFCRLVRAIGLKVWVAPWVQLNHCGYYKFPGNPQALSAPASKETD